MKLTAEQCWERFHAFNEGAEHNEICATQSEEQAEKDGLLYAATQMRSLAEKWGRKGTALTAERYVQP